MKTTRLFLYLTIAVTGPAVFGQTCFDDDLRGSYGYLATLGVNSVSTTPETPPATFSSSPIGTLLGAVAGVPGSVAASTLYFDGAGRIWGTATSASFAQSTTASPVGSYAVAPDCTLRITLNDVIAPGATTATPGTASLLGLVVRRGDEIYLGQLTPTATGTTPATGTAARNQRIGVRLIRYNNPYSAACSVSRLKGVYALIGEGFSTLPTGQSNANPVTPYFSTFLARVNFDGNGGLIVDPVAGTSALGTFQHSGTYSVNADCSGTITLGQPAIGTTTPPAAATTVRFLLAPGQGYEDNRLARDAKPGLLFSISNANQTLTGIGQPQ